MALAAVAATPPTSAAPRSASSCTIACDTRRASAMSPADADGGDDAADAAAVLRLSRSIGSSANSRPARCETISIRCRVSSCARVAVGSDNDVVVVDVTAIVVGVVGVVGVGVVGVVGVVNVVLSVVLVVVSVGHVITGPLQSESTPVQN